MESREERGEGRGLSLGLEPFLDDVGEGDHADLFDTGHCQSSRKKTRRKERKGKKGKERKERKGKERKGKEGERGRTVCQIPNPILGVTPLYNPLMPFSL
jgi:hypothetical protein